MLQLALERFSARESNPALSRCPGWKIFLGLEGSLLRGDYTNRYTSEDDVANGTAVLARVPEMGHSRATDQLSTRACGGTNRSGQILHQLAHTDQGRCSVEI
jgi:hypothetical protein